MLLPINDSVGGAIAFKVFQEVERYLREGKWCYYKFNSGLMDILEDYKKNLKSHLNDGKVLKIIAEKNKVGTLVKIDIVNQVEGVDLSMTVYGDEEDDIYFKEKMHLNKDDIVSISQTVMNWLDIYEKTIPYDGRITGILGSQFTIDIGKSYGVKRSDSVFLTRPIRKKRHPLLKEVVEWETEKIAEGIVERCDMNQSHGTIQKYISNKRPAIHDWIVIKKNRFFLESDLKRFSGGEKYKFGKLGIAGVYFNIGKGSDTVYVGETKKISGMLLGMSLKGELWATRSFWGSLELEKKFGSFEKDTGTLTEDSNSTTTTTFRLRGGYRYLPLGFFYGPQVDLYLGYGRYVYGLTPQVTDGFVESTFSGFLFGVRGNVPMSKGVRLFAELDFIPFASYEESVRTFGADDSVSSYHIEFGGNFFYTTAIILEGAIGINTNKVKFKSPTMQAEFKDTYLKSGIVFTY